MNRYRHLLLCLVVLLAFTMPVTQLAFALNPLTSGTYSPGTIVVPMDDKQADRVHVYGFVHEFLRDNPGSKVARIIEPPNVVLQTDLTPAGVLYQGGPFLIDPSYAGAVSAMLANVTFSKVTITTLTTTFTSNRLLYVTQPTKILVISDGYWGKTYLTLSRMGISYTQISTDDALADPSIVNQYTLIVLDSPGWYGNPSAYSPLHRSEITAVYNAIQARVAAGNEVMYTDAAIFDLNSTFPGYIQLGNPGETGSWVSEMHNPPLGSSGVSFDSEFPSQYYNPGPNPNRVKIFTEEGVGNWVPNGVQPAHAGDVRILMDTTDYGIPKYPYAILAFYFPYGNGIVEGLALQPYEELYPLYADYNGYYAVYQLYGNKFVEGITPDFSLTASPSSVTVKQTETASYQVTVTSLSSFTGTINLQVSGLPAGSQAVFSPTASVSLSQGQSATESLNVLTTTSTPQGSYNLTISGMSTSPLITHTATVGLVVSGAPPPDFGMTVSPSQVSIPLGQCGNFTITVTSMYGFNSPVNLTLSGVPEHVSHQFSSNPITPPPNGMASSTLKICVASNTAPGSYTVTVTGTSGPLVHTATAALAVPTPVVPPFNPLIFWIVIGLLLLALGLALAILALARKGLGKGRLVPAPAALVVAPPILVPARGPRVQYVLPVPTVRCRYCGRVMPLNSVYCPFCGKPQVVLAPPPTRLTSQRGLSRRNLIAVILALLSGVLVLLNSAALLSPSFWALWTSVFFWLPTIGPSYAFMIGAIIGLTLILGAIIMALSNGALADVIIFPFAIFSLMIGGGFIAGMILGILAGILALARRNS